jgi:hypothetical protein
MLRAVVDSNAVDHLPEHLEAVQEAIKAGRLELLWTHVTIDELAVVPDPDRRAWLLCLAASVCRFVSTGAFVLDFSRLDMARLNDDREAFEAFRDGNLRHTRDAIVTVTAAVENAVIVTYDGPMRSRAERRDLVVCEWSELLAVVA